MDGKPEPHTSSNSVAGGGWFAALEGAFGQEPASRPPDSPAADAHTPVNVDDAAYLLGAASAWVPAFPRYAYAYDDESADGAVHLALDSIMECLDMLRPQAPSDRKRVEHLEQLVEQARDHWNQVFGSAAHQQDLAAALEESDPETAEITIRKLMNLAPLKDHCNKMASAVTAVASQLGGNLQKRVLLGLEIVGREATIRDLLLAGLAHTTRIREILLGLPQVCSQAGMPSTLAGQIPAVLERVPDNCLWLYAPGMVNEVHNRIRRHLGGDHTNKAGSKTRVKTLPQSPGKRHNEVLKKLYDEGAFDEQHQLTQEDVVFKINRGLSPRTFSKEVAALARQRLIETAAHRGGGMHLTAEGRRYAARLPDDVLQ